MPIQVNPYDELQLGTTSDTIGFYGATPGVQAPQRAHAQAKNGYWSD